MIPIEPQVYTAREVGKIMKLGKNSVYLGMKTGDIPSIKVNGRLLIPKAALDKMLSGEPSGRA